MPADRQLSDPPVRFLPVARSRLVVVATAAVIFAVLAGYVMVTARGGGADLFAGPPPVNPAYAVSGLLVGLLVGLTGVGGGSLMTPILVLAFGFHPGTAVGTDLLYAASTKSIGTAVHAANRTVDWRIAGRLALGSIPAALATLLALYLLGVRGDAASKLISVVLGFALMLTAASLVFRQRILAFASARFGERSPHTTAILTTGLGAALGVLITVSSVGAGAIGVTVLLLLYPRTPLARIVGADIAHAVPLTLIAGVGHWLLGSVNLGLLGSLLVGSIPGIILGSSVTARIPERVLRPIMATTLAVVGARMTQ